VPNSDAPVVIWLHHCRCSATYLSPFGPPALLYLFLFLFLFLLLSSLLKESGVG
jgi:hypothetical protein